MLAEVHAFTQLDSIGPEAVSMDHAETQNYHHYPMGGSQPDAILDPTARFRPMATDGCIQRDYNTPSLPKALGYTAQSIQYRPNHNRTDLPSTESELEDILDLTGAKSTAGHGTLQCRAYLENLLQQITTLLSQLERLQQTLQTLKMRDDATPDLLETIATIFRRSRLAQFYVQEYEIRMLQALRSPVLVEEIRPLQLLVAEQKSFEESVSTLGALPITSSRLSSQRFA